MYVHKVAIVSSYIHMKAASDTFKHIQIQIHVYIISCENMKLVNMLDTTNYATSTLIFISIEQESSKWADLGNHRMAAIPFECPSQV